MNYVIEGNRVRGVRFVRSPNQSGGFQDPLIIVQHYTASGGEDGDGDAQFFKDPGRNVSAHFVIGRAGDITQCVELNRKAWHAGVSVWKGKTDCNRFAIGIELDNWGWLTKRANGRFYSHTGTEVPADKVVEASKHGHKYWEAFTPEQLIASADLSRALRAHFPTIEQIVGHSDIAPTRKTDPGGAFDMPTFLGMVEGRDSAPAYVAPADKALWPVPSSDPDKCTMRREVTATRLNVRAKPSTTADTLGQFNRETIVNVIYNGVGWDMVTGVALDGGVITGWCSDTYLREVP